MREVTVGSQGDRRSAECQDLVAERFGQWRCTELALPVETKGKHGLRHRVFWRPLQRKAECCCRLADVADPTVTDLPFEAAKHDACAALDRNPAFTQAQALLGIARIHLGEVDKGLELLGRAIEANKADPHRFRHLREQALGHFVAGRLDRAIEITRHLVEQAPDLDRNRLFLAVLLQAAGDTTGARTQWLQLGEPAAMRQIHMRDRSAAETFAGALRALSERQGLDQALAPDAAPERSS